MSKSDLRAVSSGVSCVHCGLVGYCAGLQCLCTECSPD